MTETTTLAEAMALLPPTPRGIYEFFRREGVKGMPGSFDRCPVARWLSERTGRTIHVGVSMAYTHNADGEPFEQVVLPRGVALFTHEFDNGALLGREALIG